MPGLLKLGVVSCFLHMKSFPAQHLHTNHTYGSPGAQLVMLPWTKLTNACSKIDMSGCEPGSHAFVSSAAHVSAGGHPPSARGAVS